MRDILDPYVCLAAIAVATSTMHLGPMVTPLIRRRPAVVARRAVTLDLLSHARLVLGFGIGDDGGKGELSSFGEITDAPTRGRALSEGLDVLTGLLSGEEVHHVGEFHRADGVNFLPVTERPNGIPIWLAARWPNQAPIRRAAKYQGVVVIQMTSPSDVRSLIDQLATAGADLEHFDIVALGAEGDDPNEWPNTGVTWLLTQLGPYELTFTEALERASAGPTPQDH